jgi:hypothetical protein
MQAQSITIGELSSAANGYSPAVRDIQDIRFQNLAFLLEECAEEIGSHRGAAALLATLSGVKPSLISMLVNHALHSETGKRRLIGDETATKLEKGMEKPTGWLDVDRSEAKNYREAALLDKFRLLSAEQLAAIEQLLDSMNAGRQPPSPDTPVTPPNAPHK